MDGSNASHFYCQYTFAELQCNIAMKQRKETQRHRANTNLTPETEILNLCLEVPNICYLGSIVSEEQRLTLRRHMKLLVKGMLQDSKYTPHIPTRCYPALRRQIQKHPTEHIPNTSFPFSFLNVP